MNMNQLAQEITKREGKRVAVNIGQVKEILKIVSCMAVKNPGVLASMIKCGIGHTGKKAAAASKKKAKEPK